MIGAFPAELFALPQWVNYRIEYPNGNPTKVPYDPRSGYGASSVNPDTWTDAATVLNGTSGQYDGAGLMLSETDGLTCIDLDNPFRRIVAGVVETITPDMPEEYAQAQRTWASYEGVIRDFDSYTEWSPSGCGFHIWIRGKLPENYGARKGTFEVYSRKRFLTVTGAHLNITPLTINDRQGALDQFARVLGLDAKRDVEALSQPQTRDDIEVFNAITSSAAGGKFTTLWQGDISGYPSGSEADQALSNYICYFTDNTAQAERLFRMSPHFANRVKLHTRDDLVKRVISKGFDLKTPPIDFETIKRLIETQRAQTEQAWASPDMHGQAVTAGPPAAAPSEALHQELPPGLLGAIAGFLYEAAPRQVPECALAGAIGLMSGLCGRAYNVSRTGLNNYVVMIGISGIGKESIASGIDRLLDSIKDTLPSVAMFRGPDNIQSAPGLYKMFGPQDQKGGTPSFLTITYEFGKWLNTVTSDRAGPNDQMLHRAYLDLWGKSGRGQYAGGFKYSDSAKDLPRVQSPAFSLIGDTVPSRFFEAVNPSSIEGGLIPRMLLVQYKGDRPPNNALQAAYARPGPHLIASLKALVEICLTRNQMSDPIDVQFTQAATQLLDDFDKEVDQRINANLNNEVICAIWNRSHLKAMKLAALRAVGNSPHGPVIDSHDAAWAIKFVRNDAQIVLSQFETGQLSTGIIDDDKQNAILRNLALYIQKGHAGISPSHRARIGAKLPEHGIMPLWYLALKIKQNKAFKHQYKTINEVVQSTLKTLDDFGLVRTVTNDKGDPLLTSLGLPQNLTVYVVAADVSRVMEYAPAPDAA